MKVKIGPYVNRWICNIHEDYMESKYGNRYADSSDQIDYYVEALEGIMQSIYNYSINLYLDKRERSVKVDIHKYDTWSMDTTLAHIVVPMLKQLKATTHGYPSGLTEEEWNDNLDAMIFSFESKLMYWEDQFYSGEHDTHWTKLENGMTQLTKGPNDTFEVDYEGLRAYQERVSNGFKLFGKYYEGLWD